MDLCLCLWTIYYEQSSSLDLLFLSSQKNVLPALEQSVLIYKFQCWCEADFIDRMIQRLEVRVRQHVPWSLLSRSQELTSGCSQEQESAFGKHLGESYICQADYSDQCFYVSYKAYGFCSELQPVFLNTFLVGENLSFFSCSSKLSNCHIFLSGNLTLVAPCFIVLWFSIELLPPFLSDDWTLVGPPPFLRTSSSCYN